MSGLERRLAHLLGIRNFSRRNLGDIAYDIYAEVDATPGDEFRFRVRHRDTGAIVLSSSTKYATRKLAKTEMQRAIGCALTPAGYERKVAADARLVAISAGFAGQVRGVVRAAAVRLGMARLVCWA